MNKFPFSSKNNRSGFFYLHRSIDKTPDIWKVGVTLSPYSAVRARSKFTWEKFVLDHLYFGVPADVGILEETVKNSLYERSGAHLNGLGGQTEIFNITEAELLEKIQQIIITRGLNVSKLELGEPYCANNKTTCPLGLPGEQNMLDWTLREVEKQWPGSLMKKRPSTNIMFNLLFE
jgi:hypothetical protein